MESYAPLLEKTRIPQPALQKLAVISIFSKLRSSPNHLNSESEPGKRAISQCLTSSSPNVVDESVRQLCRLVTDGVVSVTNGLLELQSAVEGSDPKFVPVFVKGLGFLVRFGFQKNNGGWKFASVLTHPFVMMLSCRVEVQSELLQQVLLFMLQNKHLGMVQVCEFVKPLLDFSIIRLLGSESPSSSFGLQLVSSMASFCCSCPSESMPVLKLLMGCLKYLPHETSEDYMKLVFVVEHMVEAYIVVLKSMAGEKLLIAEVQLRAVEFLGTVLSLLTCLQWHSGGHEPIIELSRRLFSVQKDLGLQWEPGLSTTMASLFTILVQSELEHEQISISKLLLLLLKWKYDKDDAIAKNMSSPFEEILFLLPCVSLMSSPSKYVKALATDLILILEKLLVKMLVAPRHKPIIDEETHYLSTPGIIVLRLLRQLWYQDGESSSRISLLNLALKGMHESEIMHDKPISWASHLRGLCLSIVERRKSKLPLLLPQELFLTETPFLSAVLSVLLIHPSMGAAAVDSLSSIAIMDPKLGVPLLLAIMFYSNIFTRNDIICHDMLLKIFEMLPSLASHSAMTPLVVQTILPMLNKDAKNSLYAMGTRLLCRTWEINDRAFGSLQGVLLPKGFTDFTSDRAICISLAASIRDVCHKSPDRGVDLILTVSSCIECQDPIVKALGLQSLVHLCEADVIDFYTAWDVIAKHVQGYKEDPIIAHSTCLLLRWGAMDAEAYPEASKGVMLTLWDLVTSSHGTKWEKTKIAALEALIQYEVPQLEKIIPDFKKMNLELFFSETSPMVLKVMGDFHVKIITYEHINRRRLVKGKRVAGSKIEKLMDVFPQAIFSSGKINEAIELPGAALLCFSFTPKNMNELQASKRPRYVHAAYENALKEISASLHLSRNILLALMSLQSWKDFMRRWVKAYIMSYDAKAQLSVLDKTSKAASDILKSMTVIADEAIPRAAENIALAIGALCVVLPPSVHTVKSAASNFLMEWLLQHEHEHRQWSAAISLGLISSCLHVTDHKERYHNITGLLEVLFVSKSSLVKGACGVGLGFLCQDLVTRVEAADDSTVKKETEKVPESKLLGRIIGALATMIQQRTKCSLDALDSLCSTFPLGYDVNADIFQSSSEDNEDLEEDIWGVAGLVLGLATSISALYRAGDIETVIKIKKLIVSWLPYMNSLFQSSDLQGGKSDIVLALGSCIALPTVVTFCQRMELMDDNELDHIALGFKKFISELISVKESGVLHHSLLMASCIGAGTVISCILNEGVHSVEVERVKCLLELFRKCYSSPFPFLVHLGGMLGVVAAMGAGTGILVYMNFPNYTRQSTYQEDSSSVTTPLLSSSVCEPYLTSLVQEMFLVAQNPDNHQLQQFASWALAFLRHHLWSKELLGADGDGNVTETNSKPVSHNFPEDSVVFKLSLWLMEFKNTEQGSTIHAGTIVAILGCLSRAPRLPSMDWGAVIRRCMRYEAKVTDSIATDSVCKKGTLREECVLFAIAHANQFDSLLTFLDELSDFSRFKTLEINLQCCLLNHLADLVKVYSSSRLEKLFGDVGYHLSSLNSYKEYDTYKKCLLRLSCWKGLYECLNEVSVDTSSHISHAERCMEVLFTLLPVVKSSGSVMSGDTSSVEEWSEAVRCLGKAPQGWLLDFLKVSQEGFVQSSCKSFEVQKKVHAKIKIVKTGSLPLIELGKMKSYILSSKSQGIWDVLLEVAAVLYHAEIGFKRQWLIDALEISCVSSFPSTALQFIGLLSATCCKYMPFINVDQQTVLNDLPVTLVSLLADKSWNVVAETVVSHLFSSTERIYDWTMHIADSSYVEGSQTIDESENHMVGDFLLQEIHTFENVFVEPLIPQNEIYLESSFKNVSREPDFVNLDPTFKLNPPAATPPVSYTHTVVDPLDADPSSAPYDPKMNYLSLRPQFLHYRPKPQIELEDRFIMSASFSDSEVTEDTQSEESLKESEDVSSDETLKQEEDQISEPSPVRTLLPEETVEVKDLPKWRFSLRSKAVALILLLSIAFVSISVTNSPGTDHAVFGEFYEAYKLSEISEFARANFDQFSQFSIANYDSLARNLHIWFTKSLYSITELISDVRGSHNLAQLQYFNLTLLNDYTVVNQYPICGYSENEIGTTNLHAQQQPVASEIAVDENFGDISAEHYEVYEEQLHHDIEMATGFGNALDALESEEVHKGQPATIFESEEQALQLSEIEHLDAKLAQEVGVEGVPDSEEALVEAFKSQSVTLEEPEQALQLVEAAKDENQTPSDAELVHLVDIDDTPESEEAFKPVTLVDTRLAQENQTPRDVDGDSEYKPNSNSEAAEIHNKEVYGEDSVDTRLAQESDAKLNGKESVADLKHSPVSDSEAAEIHTDDKEVGESASTDAAAIRRNEQLLDASYIPQNMVLYLLLCAGTIIIAGATFNWSRKVKSISRKPNIESEINQITPDKPSGRNAPAEMDDVGESSPSEMVGESCPSEFSSFEKSSSYRVSQLNEATTSIDKKRRNNYRRESLVSSNSMDSPSYGSLTVFEKIPKGRGDDEIVTPVRRSSRIRSLATSPV